VWFAVAGSSDRPQCCPASGVGAGHGAVRRVGVGAEPPNVAGCPDRSHPRWSPGRPPGVRGTSRRGPAFGPQRGAVSTWPWCARLWPPTARPERFQRAWSTFRSPITRPWPAGSSSRPGASTRRSWWCSSRRRRGAAGLHPALLVAASHRGQVSFPGDVSIPARIRPGPRCAKPSRRWRSTRRS